MAMRKWSVIEEDLKKAYAANDPRLLHYLGEVHERLREQHQQIMALAEYVDKSTTLMQQMVGSFKSAQEMMKTLGAKESVVQIEGDPDEKGSTYHNVRENG